MLEEMKKRSFKKSLFGNIVLIIVGIALMAALAKKTFIIMKGADDFYELEDSKLKDKIVDIYLDYSYGVFAEYETTTTSSSGYKSSKITEVYYIIPTADGSLMGVCVPASMEKALEKISDQTYEYLNSSGTTGLEKYEEFRGVSRKMTGEELDYFKKRVAYVFGMEVSEVDEYIIPYVLHYGELDTTASYVLVFLFELIGLALIASSVYAIIFAKKGGHQKKYVKYLEENGIRLDDAIKEYDAATQVGEVKIGRRYIFYYQGKKALIVKNSEIEWAYFKRTTHRTNGVKTGTSYDLIFCIHNAKRNTTVSMPNEAKTIEALEIISNYVPNAVVGYTDDLNVMYNRQHQEFLNLRFNLVNRDEYYSDPYRMADETAASMQSETTENVPEDDPFASVLNR